MRVASIHLQNFKRFTDLKVAGIPASASLVVLVGPNGCGKSSLFDAFVKWHRQATGLGYSDDRVYYDKTKADPLIQVSLHDDASVHQNSLYVRTAYRNDADFQSREIKPPRDPVTRLRFSLLIEDDKAVAENYDRLVFEALGTMLGSAGRTKLGAEVVEDLLGDVNRSLQRTFGNLAVANLVDESRRDQDSRAFYFEKGSASSYHYKNLSGGEKAVFDLLLDLHIKRKFFSDAIYCIDEVEAHLHTGLQRPLLQELVAKIPGNSQLWITTHSLGVLRAVPSVGAK